MIAKSSESGITKSGPHAGKPYTCNNTTYAHNGKVDIEVQDGDLLTIHTANGRSSIVVTCVHDSLEFDIQS